MREARNCDGLGKRRPYDKISDPGNSFEGEVDPNQTYGLIAVNEAKKLEG